MSSDTDVADTSVRAALNPPLKRMLAGVGASAFGGGLTMALFVVYLHSVRDFPLQTAGLVLTYQALLGLLLAPLVGTIVDRIGPQPVLLVACLVEAVATFSFGLVTTVPQAVGVATAAK